MIYRPLAQISLAGFLLASAAGMASAQTTSSQMNGLKLSNDQPIQIESDALEIREQDKTALFSGNVKVVQGTTTLQSGNMTVHYRGEGTTVTNGNADIEKIDVAQKVFLSSALLGLPAAFALLARRFGRVLLMVCWYGDAGRVQWHDAITGAKLGEGPIARA